MTTLYFSGTGNTKYIAELFCKNTNAECHSIEEDIDFSELIASSETVCVCYPIYGSRVPLIMREFIARHKAAFENKRLIIFVTQLMFSGDGARVLCDLFPKNYVDVIYAEHFFMPNNVCNFAILRKTSDKGIQRRLKMAERKMSRVCRDIESGVVKRRGFSVIPRLLGKAQGIPWQGDGKNAFTAEGTMEYRAKSAVQINADCTACNACVARCPMKNLENRQGKIVHNNNCTTCYRCVNLCPQRAVTVFFHNKPQWQYKGI